MNNSRPGDDPLYPCSHAGCQKYVDDSIDEYGELCPEHYAEHEQCRAEDAYERQQEQLMETGGIDTSRQDQELRDAGRGHLVRP